MAFNINEFKNRGLIWGGARPSLFQVILTPPPNIGVNQAISSERLAFTCRAAELPEMTISNIEVPYFGRKIKIAGDRTYADWSITVMNDEDFIVRSMFEAWSNAINRVVANVRDPDLISESNLVASYKVDVGVIQYGKDGIPLRGYNLIGAFPTTIGAIALDWETQNSVETFSVSFAYDYWVPNPDLEALNPRSVNINAYFGATVAGPGQ